MTQVAVRTTSGTSPLVTKFLSFDVGAPNSELLPAGFAPRTGHVPFPADCNSTGGMTEVPAGGTGTSAVIRRELVIMDAAVPDQATLLAAVPPSADVFLLDPNADPLTVLGAFLDRAGPYDAVHLVDGDLGVGKRELRGVIDHFFQ